MIFGRCCSRIGEQGQGDQRVRNAKNYATSLRLRGHVAPFCFLRTHRATRSLTAEVAGGFSRCGVRDRAHARMLAFSPGGVLLVTDMSDGKVLAFPDPKHTGRAERTVTVLDDLNAPHGIAF